MHPIFKGAVPISAAEAGFSVFNLFQASHFIQGYLAFFGVPLGNYKLLIEYVLPLNPLLLVGWLLATILFIIPLFLGVFLLRTKKPAMLLYIWIFGNIVGLAIYIINIGDAYSRLLMPMFPALAMLWAIGFDRLVSAKNTKRIAILLFLAVVAVFITAGFTKIVIASDAWDRYEVDFAWIRENTPKDSFIYYNGQCLSPNVDRLADFELDKPEAFLWINPNFPLETVSEVNTTILSEFTNYTLVYHNDDTGTEIYHVYR
jgi:hypothetical protein